MGPLPCFKGKKLLGPSFSGPVLRFKGKEGPSLECLEDDEEEEDLDTESMRKLSPLLADLVSNGLGIVRFCIPMTVALNDGRISCDNVMLVEYLSKLQ